MLLTSPATASDAGGVAGSWTGEMRQIDPAPVHSYAMSMTLNGKKGTTSYPSLKCGGKLTRIAQNGAYTVYREKITYGALSASNASGCIDGMITVTPAGNTLVLGWFASFEDKPSLASAVLSRGKAN